MNVIVCVLLADGVHGKAKFGAVMGFGGLLNVGQQHQHELWDTNDDTICGHLHRIQVHQLHVDADLLVTVKVVINHLDQLL